MGFPSVHIVIDDINGTATSGRATSGSTTRAATTANQVTTGASPAITTNALGSSTSNGGNPIGFIYQVYPIHPNSQLKLNSSR